MKKEIVHKKKIVQDVVPSPRSIRNVALPSRLKRTEQIEQSEIQTEVERRKKMESAVKKTEIPEIKKEIPAREPFSRPVSIQRVAPMITITPPDQGAQNAPPSAPVPPTPPVISTPSYSYEYDEPHKSSRKALYITFVLFFIALAFGISALFKSAEIRITPRNQIEPLDTTFIAKKDATGMNLGFQLVTITKDVEKTVTATGEQNVQKKAQGNVILYNNFSSQSQKLVINTRLQTPEGLIYRLIQGVTIPGKQGATPGQIEVTVIADAVGPKYNIGLKDFVIPGFKGDPKYVGIYARSKTAMSGGFSGMQKIVSGDVLGTSNTELETTLKASLAKDIMSQIPANFVMYTNDVSYSFDALTQASGQTADSGATTSTAILHKKGTVNAVIFDRAALSHAIIEKVLASSTPDIIKIPNLDLLTFTYPENATSDPATATTITFNLKGDANLVWVFDENKLKSDLLGISKGHAREIIMANPAIKESWIVTRPFWNSTIPSDPNKVTFINTLDLK